MILGPVPIREPIAGTNQPTHTWAAWFKDIYARLKEMVSRPELNTPILLKVSTSVPSTPSSGYVYLYLDPVSGTLRMKYSNGSIWEVTLNPIP